MSRNPFYLRPCSLCHAGKQFDAVLGLELIEHVEKPADFVKSLSSLTKSEGALLMSTINRTPRGYLLAVLGAEYVAGILPKGTHDWHKFITPGGKPKVEIQGEIEGQTKPSQISVVKRE